MKLGLVQMNPTIGDIEGNKKTILTYVRRARQEGADLLVFPELVLTGWPPKGLLLHKDFLLAVEKALEEIQSHSQGIGILLGTVLPAKNSNKLTNSAVLMEDGKIIGRVDKCRLRNDSMFQETAYFLPASETGGYKFLEFRNALLGVFINDVFPDEYCMTSWSTSISEQNKPTLLINLSAVPYHYRSLKKRQADLSGLAEKLQTPLFSVNQVGGNDELIFDGSSMVFDKYGKLRGMAKHFDEDFFLIDTEKISLYPELIFPQEDISWVYRALVLGLRDYFQKAGFKKLALGLSGGIDSALVACLAADALGNDNVLGVSMPSRYSTDHSKDDARRLANNLKIEYRVYPIEELFSAYIKLFNPGGEVIGDLAEENIQARIRGNLLMFISNREGHIVVNTSNKSEASVGYTTLYGDMCGSLSPLADIPKTMVYELCKYINRDREVIPANIITKPPSAELRPGQLDQDSLPDYSVLDPIIELYKEERLPAEEIVSRGYEKETVSRIINMLDRTEYKKRQMPPMLKVTSSSLGARMPLIQGFRRNE